MKRNPTFSARWKSPKPMKPAAGSANDVGIRDRTNKGVGPSSAMMRTATSTNGWASSLADGRPHPKFARYEIADGIAYMCSHRI
jgi:hypothetical protein